MRALIFVCVVTQVVNDTEPIYYYCATPEHCQKGMFGIINPPSSPGSSTSLGGMMQGMASSVSFCCFFGNHFPIRPFRTPTLLPMRLTPGIIPEATPKPLFGVQILTWSKFPNGLINM